MVSCVLLGTTVWVLPLSKRRPASREISIDESEHEVGLADVTLRARSLRLQRCLDSAILLRSLPVWRRGILQDQVGRVFLLWKGLRTTALKLSYPSKPPGLIRGPPSGLTNKADESSKAQQSKEQEV